MMLFPAAKPSERNTIKGLYGVCFLGLGGGPSVTRKFQDTHTLIPCSQPPIAFHGVLLFPIKGPEVAALAGLHEGDTGLMGWRDRLRNGHCPGEVFALSSPPLQ